MRVMASSTDLGPRLAVVLSHPIQYLSPWFAHIAAHSGLTLKVFYLWDAGVRPTPDRDFGVVVQWDIPLLNGYAHEFVPNRSRDPGTHHVGGLDNPDLPARLAAWRPDAILMFGYAYRSQVRVLLSRQLRGVPMLFRGDSHELGRPQRARALLGRVLRRVLFRRFAACLAVGAANRTYFTASGVPSSRIHHVPHCVDHDRFRRAESATRESAARWREERGIAPQDAVLLFVGKLEPNKAPLLLLDAFVALTEGPRSTDPRPVLVFVGSGPLEPELRRRAGQRVGQDIHLVPFCNQSAMPAVYAAGQVLVLPSESETWGLVVNEAMCLGVPAIVSDRVGCGPDLVIPGRTGWIVPTGDAAALTQALASATREPAQCAAMGRAARDHIDQYSYDNATVALTGVVRTVLAARDQRRFTNAA